MRFNGDANLHRDVTYKRTVDRMPYPIFHGSAACYFHRPLMGALRFLRNSRRRERGNPECAGCNEISFSIAIFPGITHNPYFAFRKYIYLFFFSFTKGIVRIWQTALNERGNSGCRDAETKTRRRESKRKRNKRISSDFTRKKKELSFLIFSFFPFDSKHLFFLLYL